MVKNQDRFRDFIHAFTSHWFNYMSGGLSVPAAILALYVQSGIAQAALWITAAACLVWSGFLLWRTERRRVTELEEKLNRELILRFEPCSPWIVKLDKSNLQFDSRGTVMAVGPSWWFRVELHNQREAVLAHKCRVYVRDIEYKADNSEVFESAGFGTSQNLRWSNTPDGTDYEPKDIGHSARVFADVISTDGHHRRLFIKWGGEWYENDHLFDRFGIYRITIGASSEDAGETSIVLLAKWNGQWNQIEVTEEK